MAYETAAKTVASMVYMTVYLMAVYWGSVRVAVMAPHWVAAKALD